MRNSLWRLVVVGLICLFVGVGVSAVVMAAIPVPGSAPSIFDDFNFSSTGSGFWHVNPVGATARIKHGVLTLTGAEIELDRRIQTDPNATVVVMKVRGQHFRKFGFGLGVYHAGTVGVELDDDGAKCGRGSDFGYRVDFIKAWKTPPVNKWMYLSIKVTNPYPDPKVLAKLGDIDPKKLKPVTVTCSLYDASGRLVSTVTPTDPQANAHYVSFDETYLRTWDHSNEYQVDWVYAGPPSGSPLKLLVH